MVDVLRISAIEIDLFEFSLLCQSMHLILKLLLLPGVVLVALVG